jgi:hypothetical protein
MTDIRELTKRIMLCVGVLAMATIIIFLVFFTKSAKALTIGLAFGASIGMLGFIDLSHTLQRAVQKGPAKAQSYTVRKYFMRYIMTGVVLYIAVVAPYINVIGTLIGLLLIKFAIMITNLFNDKEFYKNIIQRKEV